MADNALDMEMMEKGEYHATVVVKMMICTLAMESLRKLTFSTQTACDLI